MAAGDPERALLVGQLPAQRAQHQRAGANDSTVAEVMKPTSFCQLGNGRKTISPTTNVTIRLINGTPRRSSAASASGALPLRAMA